MSFNHGPQAKQQLQEWIMHYRVRLDCNTTVTGMERDPAGEGWILHTIKSTTSSIYKEVAREEAFDFVINAAGAGSAKIANLILEAMASLKDSTFKPPKPRARRRSSISLAFNRRRSSISLASTTMPLYRTLQPVPTLDEMEKPSPSSTKNPEMSSIVIPGISIGVGIMAAMKSRKLLCGLALGIGTIKLMSILFGNKIPPQVEMSLPETAQVLKDKTADRFLEMKASYVLKIPCKSTSREPFPEIAILGVRGTKLGMVQVSPYKPPANDHLHLYYHIHSMTMTATLFPGGIIGDRGKMNAFPTDLQAIIDLPEWQQVSGAKIP